MYRFIVALAVVLGVVAVSVPSAFAGSGYSHGYGWVNDHDGDGIPNGQDEDWIRPLDGSGYMFKHGFAFLTTPSMYPLAISHTMLQYRLRDRDMTRTRDYDRTRDQIRLRLRDKSCQ